MAPPEGGTADRAQVAGFAAALAEASSLQHAVGLSSKTVAEPLLTPSPNGHPTVGRFAGRVTVDGRSMVLSPAIGWPALERWTEAATGLAVPAAVVDGDHVTTAPLVAMLWVRAVDGASRHGPPAFRHDVPHVGESVRGRLDVRQTVRMRARGDTMAASVYRSRDLDNPVTRVVVAADRVLARHVGQTRWRTDRVEQVLAQISTAVGRRTPAPGEGELRRMRYTPITRPFKWAAELSSRIVRQDPVATTAPRGRLQGLVLDLDDIYGGAILSWTRLARPDLTAELTDAGHVTLRDGRTARARLSVLAGAGAGGAPAVAIDAPPRASRVVALAPDTDESAAALRRALGDL